jgi:hypothetical protein
MGHAYIGTHGVESWRGNYARRAGATAGAVRGLTATRYGPQLGKFGVALGAMEIVKRHVKSPDRYHRLVGIKKMADRPGQPMPVCKGDGTLFPNRALFPDEMGLDSVAHCGARYFLSFQ